jgi:AraC family transcriptional regulator of arabinose operon
MDARLTLPVTADRRSPVRAAAPCGRMHIVRDGFLYAGVMERVVSHRHSAMLYLALSPEPFHVQAGDAQVLARAALIGPDQRKQIDGRGAPLACVDISPTHRAFATFARGGEAVTAWSRGAFDDEDAALRAFREQRLGAAEADALYGRLVAQAVAQLPPAAPVDARVREVMRLLRAAPATDLRSLASAVHLSPDWLVHLFRRELGLSLRKYAQTLKLQAAAAYLRRGVSLTEVAAEAGFADSAHFSKLWKQHFGFAPQRAFTGEEVSIDPLPWPPCTGNAAPAHAPGAPS